MARSLAYIWAAGGTLLALTVALPHPGGANELGLLIIAGLAVVVAGVMRGVHGLPTRVFEAILALGTVLIGCTVVLSGSATSAYALFLVWLTVHAFYFLPWARAAPQLVLMVAVYAGALLIGPSPEGERTIHLAMTIGTLLVTAAFVGLLKARVDRLVLRLTDAARRDFLTGLLNRRGFDDTFENELERVQRGSRPLSLLLIDIDHFKEVNDRFGHHVGDDVLERVALALDGARRRIDTSARIGGEEFALVLPDTDARSAYVVGERVRAAVRAATGQAPPMVTISVGLATFPDDGRDARTLMRAADQALYSAKRLGRDRVVVYSPDLEAVLKRAEAHRDERATIELATGLALAAALDLRDEGAAQHSRTVGHYAQLVARELGLPEERIERVRLAGLLHDVGKIGIPDRILHKPGPLDPAEWQLMRQHPEIGARLLAGEEVGDIRAWVLAHHERPDGGGYPYGLTACAIPLEAMILAVADAFEAMTTDRVYRPAIGPRAACDELRLGAGTQFDRHVVDAFVKAIGRAPNKHLATAAA